MDPAAHVATVEAESARFLAALRDADLSRTVPTCREWNGFDLAWHLAEVQDLWGAVVADLLEDPDDHDRPGRPPDGELLDLVADRSAALVSALRERSPQDRCWTWHPTGDTVGWVARRQAHEALIHRVDAERLAGAPITGVDPELATDGVDEVVSVLMDSPVPPWAAFTADGADLTLVATDSEGRWTLEFGRFTGTSPNTGKRYDVDDVRAVAERATDTTVTGPAWELDLWLWGRSDDSGLAIAGDASLARRLRAVAVDSMQ